VDLRLIPDDWPLADRLLPLARSAAERLDLPDHLDRLVLVPDALAADDRSWLRLSRDEDGASLTVWFHPDQVLRDRPGHGPARPEARDWELAPPPRREPTLSDDDFSVPNAQRFLCQQMLLVQDILVGRLHPEAIPPSLLEAFQEAWLVTVDGRLQRAGLPHLSAAERRMRFLRLFSPAGVLTPNHWSIFNALWEGAVADEGEVLSRVRLLPPLSRRRRV
jgi:hypothetical protein